MGTTAAATCEETADWVAARAVTGASTCARAEPRAGGSRSAANCHPAAMRSEPELGTGPVTASAAALGRTLVSSASARDKAARFLLWLLALPGSLGPVRARRLLLAGAVAAIASHSGAAQAADPIMPLSQVRQGMRCTALSVVRGTTITSFQAEVIDVVTGDPHAVGPRILIRVSGPAVDATGVGAGFSGTPLMCPDGNGVTRNAGAISEDLGDYGNHLVLATPIEQMLGQKAYPPRSARHDPALLASGRRISEPLTVTGLSATMRRLLAGAAKRAGRTVLAAPSGPFGGFPVQD